METNTGRTPERAESAAGIIVNGERHELSPAGSGTLLALLRSGLGLTGAKPGCGEGECGACTVLVDGRPALACQTAAAEVAGRSVTTIEGLAGRPRLHPVQQALASEHGFQCGYCTPAMAVRAAALLATDPDPSDQAITAALEPNLCRCGCYPRITRAVRRAAALLRDPGQQGAEPVAQVPGPFARPRRPWDLCSPQDREWFDLLGDGLVVVWSPPAPSGGAWVHLSPSGTVTAFTGKVDVGQDNRAAFRLLVAEELAVDPGWVRVVQGDTDLCPYDPGTFGSRSMPEAGEWLRRAAAGAREALLDLAARRWRARDADQDRAGHRDRAADLGHDAAGQGRDAAGQGDDAAGQGDDAAGQGHHAAGLAATGGAVTGGPGGARLTYRDLLTGQRRLDVLEAEPPVTPPTAWRIAGYRPAAARPGAAGAPDGPPVAHEGAAGDVAGRLDVVTGDRRYASDQSRPGMRYGAVLRPPVRGARLRAAGTDAAARIPGATVIRDGEFVGAVAPDLATARRAVAAIVADWETPAALPGPMAGYLRSHPVATEGWLRPVDRGVGDTEAALGTAAMTVAASYTTAYLAHVPMETRAAVAEWADGRLTVWTGNNVPFPVRSRLAATLGLDERDVRVIVPPTGGGFGGKRGDEAIEAARLARAAGCPVKVHWSRAEEFQFGFVRPMAVIDVRAALNSRGGIAAFDLKDINAGPQGTAFPYAAASWRVRYQPAASPLAQGPYRALAATANTFARESAIDELAHAAGYDPLRFRLDHLADERLATVLRAAAGSSGLGSPAPGRGQGVAVGLEKDGRVATRAEVAVDGNGTIRVTRIVTAYECGAVVSPATVLSQIEGGTAMALGGALFEQVTLADGHLQTRSLAGYRVPRFSDIPDIRVLLVDRPDVPSAGAGETPLIAVAPAIANAVFAATGRRLRSLPLLVSDGRGIPEDDLAGG
jgi:CO/xanthine dehydrogenase Mo-binding subunit/aerobic-type carbon monoxide dehydrogenase small subunit (CoxS/CutS family)